MVFVVEPVVQTLASGSWESSWWHSLSWTSPLVPGCFLGACYRKGCLPLSHRRSSSPAIFVVYLLVVRKFRAFGVVVVTGLVVTLASAAIEPAASYEFWTRLAHGDTGLGHSIIYYTNQSVMADIVRIAGTGAGDHRTRLVLCGRSRRRLGSRSLAPTR